MFKKRNYILLLFAILVLLVFPSIVSFASPHELNQLNINVFIDKMEVLGSLNTENLIFQRVAKTI